MNIYCFKLSSGEEIIAKSAYKDVNDNWYDMHVVYIVDPINFVPTNQGMAAVPWPACGSDDEIQLPTKHCLTITKVKKEIEAAYIKATTNIDIATHPNSNLII